ncbi:MAG: histidine phosphatase family protein [Promethearchaeota archaeon]
MPKNTLIFLRHAETHLDKDKTISKWDLSTKGQKDALKVTELEFLQNVDIIIASQEEKAYKTVLPLAKKLGKEIQREEKLNELNRDKGKFLEQEEYTETMKKCLTDRTQSFNNWETANSALERFTQIIEEIDSKFRNKKLLIVSHGCVINLFFAKVLGKLDNLYNRTLSNTFCDYGIIINGRVTKDIDTSR